MKKIIILSVLLITGSYTYAQYNVAIGVRSGGTSGLTLKAITSSNSAVEGILGVWNDGVSVTGLYEQHPNAFNTQGLHWLFGIGGHVAFYNEGNRGSRGLVWYSDYPGPIDNGTTGVGLDVMAGLEYKFLSIPMAISFELKPFVEFNSYNSAWYSLDPGLGVKFAF